MERMERQFAFALEADKEKNIIRHTLVSDGSRRENDAEHAWHAALMAVLLSEYANEKIDVLRTVTMLLIHDMVEIDAGDTYAYDEQANLNRREREEKAADRVFGILPDDLQPAMLNNATNGQAWVEHSVRLSQILKRNQTTPEGSQSLWDYALGHIFLPNVKKGNIIDDAN